MLPKFFNDAMIHINLWRYSWNYIFKLFTFDFQLHEVRDIVTSKSTTRNGYYCVSRFIELMILPSLKKSHWRLQQWESKSNVVFQNTASRTLMWPIQQPRMVLRWKALRSGIPQEAQDLLTTVLHSHVKGCHLRHTKAMNRFNLNSPLVLSYI